MRRPEFCVPVIATAALLMSAPAMADDCKCGKRAAGGKGESAAEQESAGGGQGGGFGVEDIAPKEGSTPPAADQPAAAADQKKADKPAAAADEKKADPPAVTPAQTKLEAIRAASLRRSAKHLGLNYDTMLKDLPAEGSPAAAADQPGDADGAGAAGADEPAEGRSGVRRERLRRLARHVLSAATNEELQGLVKTLAPDPRVALAFRVINRVGTVVKERQGESAAEDDLGDVSEMAESNREEFAAALADAILEQAEAEQLQLLQAKQAVELEVLKNRQAVERAERLLQRARESAETSQKRLEDAEKAVK